MQVLLYSNGSTVCLPTALVYSRTHKATCGHLAWEVKGCLSPLKKNRSEVLRTVSLHASRCTSRLWEAPPYHCLSVCTAGRLSSAHACKGHPWALWEDTQPWWHTSAAQSTLHQGPRLATNPCNYVSSSIYQLFPQSLFPAPL